VVRPSGGGGMRSESGVFAGKTRVGRDWGWGGCIFGEMTKGGTQIQGTGWRQRRGDMQFLHESDGEWAG